MVYKIKFSLSKRNAIKMVHHLFQVRQAQKTHLNFFFPLSVCIICFHQPFFSLSLRLVFVSNNAKKKRRRIKFTKKRQLNFEFEHMKKKRRQSTNTIKPNNNSNAEKKYDEFLYFFPDFCRMFLLFRSSIFNWVAFRVVAFLSSFRRFDKQHLFSFRSFFSLLFCQLAILKTKLPICVRGSYEITLEHWCVINFWLRECDHAEPRINVLIYLAKQIIVLGARNDDDFFWHCFVEFSNLQRNLLFQWWYN